MEEEKQIQVVFNAHESQFYDLLQKHCTGKGISISDYIKDLIKKDLAWGQFSGRKIPSDKKRKDLSAWKIEHENKR